jgi:putative transposase
VVVFPFLPFFPSDQDGTIIDILVQFPRDKPAARRFFRKLLKGSTDVPRLVITDKLKSYVAAFAPAA